jgi:hypothetical protein
MMHARDMPVPEDGAAASRCCSAITDREDLLKKIDRAPIKPAT